jgi:hypothetical protein
MRERQGGTASNRRFKLIYHYLRLLLVIAAEAPRRRRSGRARPTPDMVDPSSSGGQER